MRAENLLTMFAIPKPFRGHIDTIQRNAIGSWTLLRPRPEIILLGSDEGTVEVATEFGVRHVPHVDRNEYGTPLVSSVFEAAEAVSQTPLMAYVNSDIILMNDFMAAISRIPLDRFLMAGRRWDLDLREALEFETGDWEDQLRTHVGETGRLHDQTGIDYFVFPRGFYRDLPPFAIGRTIWDNWLIYRARSLGVPVIDASEVITAVHQNHGYSHNLDGKDGIWSGAEARQNLELAGGWRHAFTLENAGHMMTPNGLRRPKLTILGIQRQLEALSVLRPRLDLWGRLVRHMISPLSLIKDVVRRTG